MTEYSVVFQQPRELFNVENEAEKTRWLEKLNEAIVAAKKVGEHGRRQKSFQGEVAIRIESVLSTIKRRIFVIGRLERKRVKIQGSPCRRSCG